MERIPDLTIIVPAHNEEETLPLFFEATSAVLLAKMPEVQTEFVFVDDGSTDGTQDYLRGLSKADGRVRWLSFSRNFGKEAAIYAGLEAARGRNCVLMDADLQDPPALLPEMYALLTEGQCDIVGTRRVDRKGEPPIRSFFARCFYRLMRRFSQTDLVDGARDYQMMTRRVVDAVLSMGEVNRFSKGIFGWVGFRRTWLSYENVERVAGETKWSFWKLFLYAMEGITAFSTAPLVLSSVIGLVFCLLAFAAILFIIVRTLIFGDPTSGWPSLVCIIMLVTGVQLLTIGILGQYLAKTYLETKRRPLYLVAAQSWETETEPAKDTAE